jgi:hypothetical protein
MTVPAEGPILGGRPEPMNHRVHPVLSNTVFRADNPATNPADEGADVFHLKHYVCFHVDIPLHRPIRDLLNDHFASLPKLPNGPLPKRRV